MTIPIEHVVALSALLFGIGVVGALLRRNLIVILMSIELMLAASILALVGFNRQWSTAPGVESTSALDGHVFALMVIGVAAAQAAIGLAIVVALVRGRDGVNVEDASLLRW